MSGGCRRRPCRSASWPTRSGVCCERASPTRCGCGARSATSPAPASGHVYFTLVEEREDGSRACIGVMLSARNKPGVNRSLTATGGAVRMTDGTEVRIRGRVDWFAPRGQLQLRMSAIDPAYTLGQLEMARAELLARLEAEGLLRANAARALSELPLRVGLITSRGSAAEADFLHELEQSRFAFRITVVDARVQGAGAPASVRAALRSLGRRDLDVVAVVRGGGARTDLAAFDTEPLARAIAACPIPVLTGIGHEVDHSIADDVAHTSAKTPTACAALLVERVDAHRRRLEERWATVLAEAQRSITADDDRLRGHALALGGRHAGHADRRAGSSPASTASRPTRSRWRAGAKHECDSCGPRSSRCRRAARIARRRSDHCRSRPPAVPSRAARSGRLGSNGRGVRRARARARPRTRAGPRLVDHAALRRGRLA